MNIKNACFMCPVLMSLSFGTLAAECNNETMPGDFICATNEGIIPNSDQDISNLLTQLLNKSNAEKKGVFFPAGYYSINQAVNLKSYNSITGSTKGVLFKGPNWPGKAVVLGNGIYTDTVHDVNIKNIVFNNIRIYFYGRKSRVNILDNIFVNTKTYDSSAKENLPQLELNTAAYHVKGNAFLRGENYPGLGLKIFGNAQGMLIENNFWGSLDKLDLATPWMTDETRAALANLKEMREKGWIDFSGDQDYFITAWNSVSGTQKAIFRNNFVSGSLLQTFREPITGSQIVRDHAIYLKKYNDIDIIHNYFGGWPKDAYGQLKLRNAENLVFAGNTLDGINFEARPYNDLPDALFFRNTYIFNNYISEGVVDYYQNFFDDAVQSIDVKDFLVFDNVFSAKDHDKPRINASARSSNTTDFLAGGNIYEKSQDPVKLNGRMKSEDVNVLKNKLPENKQHYLDITPVMLKP